MKNLIGYFNNENHLLEVYTHNDLKKISEELVKDNFENFFFNQAAYLGEMNENYNKWSIPKDAEEDRYYIRYIDTEKELLEEINSSRIFGIEVLEDKKDIWETSYIFGFMFEVAKFIIFYKRERNKKKSIFGDIEAIGRKKDLTELNIYEDLENKDDDRILKNMIVNLSFREVLEVAEIFDFEFTYEEDLNDL